MQETAAKPGPISAGAGLSEALREPSLPAPAPGRPDVRFSIRGPGASKPPSGSLQGDLMGGFSSAIIGLPLSLAFGVAVFAPLGPGYASVGALSGLTAAVVGGAVAAWFGGTRGQITGPTGPMSVVMTALLAGLVADLPASTPEQVATILTLMFLCNAAGGALQALLGVFDVGQVARHIPYPVVAGFMNGIALIILKGQAATFIGVDSAVGVWHGLMTRAWSVPAAVLGVATLLLMRLSPYVTERVPKALAGLLGGTALYYGASAVDIHCGGVVGQVPSAVPKPDYLFVFLALPSQEALVAGLPRIVAPAVALGLLGAIDSLLTSIVADVVTGTHHNSRRELIGQGCGNVASACFGGVAGAGTTVATLVNINAGGQTRRSGVFYSVALLLVMLVGAPLAGGIPMVVLAAILVATAIGMLDSWTRLLIKRLLRQAGPKRELQLTLIVVTVVTAVTVAVDLLIAVAVGLLLAIFLFLSRMSQQVVRQVHSGVEKRSFRQRTDAERRLLTRHGEEIAVIELQGALFFASCGAVSDAVEQHMQRSDMIILDVHHLTEIDGSGAKLLLQLHEMLAKEGKELVLSYMSDSRPLWHLLHSMGDVEALGLDHIFPDTDRALEWAEDRLIAKYGAAASGDTPIPVAEMHVLRNMSEPEQCALHDRFREIHFEKDQILIDERSNERTLIIPTDGCLSQEVWNEEEKRHQRITTIQLGTVAGEESFFEGVPSSYRVRALSDGRAFVLDLYEFEQLSKQFPELTMRFLFNSCRELSARLRHAGRVITAVDH